MTTERSDIKVPVWRKKVDASIFEHRTTTIPNAYVNIWVLKSRFKDPGKTKTSIVNIKFKNIKTEFKGYIRKSSKMRNNPAWLICFDDEVLKILQNLFPMTYFRYLEALLRKNKNKLKSIPSNEIEEEIPFWEFLDIEYFNESNTIFFTPQFTQKPIFPELFKILSKSPSISSIEDELKGHEKISKSEWFTKDDFEGLEHQRNVIYYLVDEKNKELYIGEAKELKTRFKSKRTEIPNWNKIRFDVLPKDLIKYRVQIEEMIIKSFSYFFNNKKHKENFRIKTLNNKKIK
ncbi:GIY-YIG nuclease family protein [Bacteriovorax sp. Seq25_V]|uniref:GIY-YIG nuclease family protein n=1 Tax=Bacteriovorax sp. Seq25_V TaxID=1201288 RepID=UPI00038A533A|nr:GIY-YIG nuclease family protein [Bacteriovorax sp. Seq25_V]EQC47542.1 GIY-YIG catalytic domain protein [Bacteriovorax sp. Seq25_V]